MLAKVESSMIIGVEARKVIVEVDVCNMGLPSFEIVGLPDTAVRESINRVKSAIVNSEYTFPPHKITVNLAPANIKKEGPRFDLPIALGILAASEQLERSLIENKVFCGELSLDGGLRPVIGILPVAISLKNKAKQLIIPILNSYEAAVVEQVRTFALSNLCEVINFLKGEADIAPVKVNLRDIWNKNANYRVDFNEVKGQQHVKRGLEVAACGGHNILLVGPPGSGKTMLAVRLPTILSEMTVDEAIETTKVHSVAGLLNSKTNLVCMRPFRAPHHTISDIGLAGGGRHPAPGEISLANNGVLFLDEFPEFNRNVLEVLRQPLENGAVTISRAASTATYPARFMLVAAMNPCQCGYFGSLKNKCHCSTSQIQKYMSKISGPLLDRIDIHLEVPSLDYKDLTQARQEESSLDIRKRVIKYRKIQQARFKNSFTTCNAYLRPKEVEKFCVLSKDAKEILKMAIVELGFSARGYDKVLKVSRTIADMEESEFIEAQHVSEAIGYRNLDRSFMK